MLQMVVILVLVALVFGALATLLAVDVTKRHRHGAGLTVLDDRPGTDDQFATWNREDS